MKKEENTIANIQIKEKIINFLKEPLLYLMVVIIFFQTLIYSKVPEVNIEFDSAGYMEYYNRGNLFEGYLNSKRTPAYPYFIKLIKKIGGEENLEKNVVAVQKILFLISVILFYYTLKMLTKNKVILSALTLIFGICPTIFLWNTSILTEAISIIEMTFLAYITIRYLKKPSKILGVLMGFTILGMILTRPSFIYLIPIYIVFIVFRWFLNRKERKTLLFAALSILICCAIILLYCAQIKRSYGVFGLTLVSIDNTAVSVIDNGMYKNSDNKEIVAEVDALLAEDSSEIFNVYFAIEASHTIDEINDFAKSAIKNSPGYFDYLIERIINLGNRTIGISYVESETDYTKIGSLFTPITFGAMYIMCLVGIVYLIWYIIKYKKIEWVTAFFTATIFANIFTLIVGAPYEEERLFFPSTVLVILWIGYTLAKMKLGINIDKEKLLNEKNVE